MATVLSENRAQVAVSNAIDSVAPALRGRGWSGENADDPPGDVTGGAVGAAGGAASALERGWPMGAASTDPTHQTPGAVASAGANAGAALRLASARRRRARQRSVRRLRLFDIADLSDVDAERVAGGRTASKLSTADVPAAPSHRRRPPFAHRPHHQWPLRVARNVLLAWRSMSVPFNGFYLLEIATIFWNIL